METFGKATNIPIKYPPINLCTDNGVMVAWNGYEKLLSGYLLPPITNYDPGRS
jgi:tRNA A37 threonylcarbamoyltransferase TsaD